MKKNRPLSEKEVFVASHYKKEQRYWLDKLSGELIKSHFPYDHKKTGKNSEPEMKTVGFALEAGLFAKLMGLTNGLDHRVHMFLAAGLVILLGKYTGNRDIIFAVPIYKQALEGEFINTVLILRNKLENHMRFREVLRQVRQTLAEAEENQNYPLEALLPQLDNHEYLPGNECPLFDVAILLENIHHEKYLEEIKPNIVFSFLKTEKDLKGLLKYNSLLYHLTTLEQIVSHFCNLLTAVVLNIDTRVADIDILSQQEKHRLLYDFNDTRQAYPRYRTIDSLFARGAGKYPDHIALVGQGLSAGHRAQRKNMNRQIAGSTEEPSNYDCALTYREINGKSSQLALHLRAKGVEADAVVGIMMVRSLEMIIGLLGILKAGGAYLPLAIPYPEERKKYMIKASNAKILLTTGPDRVGDDPRLTVINLAEPGIYINESRYSNEPIQTQHRFDNLAYVIYTSGSRGKPKGVMIEHRNVVRLVKNTNYITFNEGERLLQTGALEFDASTFEIWGALLNGLILHLAAPEKIVVPENLKNTIKKHHINTMWITAPLFNRLLEADPEIFPGLKNLLVGGDVLSPLHINRLRRRSPLLNIINGYGPTENTTFSTTHSLDRDHEERIPIGTPVANSRAYILDGCGNLQPVKVPGELCVGGDGVARGYLNNPELTAEKFVEQLTVAGDRCRWKNNETLLQGVQGGGFLEKSPPGRRRQKLYRTGDRARWLPDGKIDFLGRLDSQVKIRGFRVEPGEIENRLRSHEKIKDAVLIVREAKDTEISPAVAKENKYLCAYYVPASSLAGTGPGKKIDASQLKAHLLKELPGYMLPRYFIPLEEIPLTLNGKVDTKSLPEPGPGDPGTGYTAPGNEIEAGLTGIWSEILGIKQETISRGDDFLSLGGHSLKTYMLTEKIHKTFNVKIPIAKLFALTVLGDQAKYIKEAAKDKHTALEIAEEKDYYELSSAQKRLYILQQMEIDNTGYNIPVVMELEGHVANERLRETFVKLIKRHESLRTAFVMMGNRVVQKIRKQADLKIEYYETGAEEAKEVVKDFVRPFDLSKELLRVGLVKIGRGKQVFMVDMHHIISDGVTMNIIINEFMTLYGGNEQLPPLKIQYRDYSEGQHKCAQSERLNAQKEYWLNQFAGKIPVLDFPSDYPRPGVLNFEGDQLRFRLDRELTKKIKRLEAEAQVTCSIVLLAIFYILLSKYTGQEDLVVGMPITGRRDADLQDIVGMFVNTLPLRNKPQSHKTVADFLDEVKESVFNGYENQDYQFDELVVQLGLQGNPNRNPLINTTFTFQNSGKQRLEIPDAPIRGLKLQPYRYEIRKAKFDLTLDAAESSGSIVMLLRYLTRLFKRETIEKIKEYYMEILVQAVDNRDVKLKDITLSHDFLTVGSNVYKDDGSDFNL